MPGVKQVENAVGQNHPTLRRAELLTELHRGSKRKELRIFQRHHALPCCAEATERKHRVARRSRSAGAAGINPRLEANPPRLEKLFRLLEKLFRRGLVGVAADARKFLEQLALFAAQRLRHLDLN